MLTSGSEADIAFFLHEKVCEQIPLNALPLLHTECRHGAKLCMVSASHFTVMPCEAGVSVLRDAKPCDLVLL